ncbi:MAG: Gfo/Idh/MocA family oxidoreductase [Bacteroidota bacterium]
MSTTNRRSFLKRSAMATSAIALSPSIIPASALGRRSGRLAPSDRVVLAFIGAGNQAINDARGFLRDERVQITTICDVNEQSTGYWQGSVAGRLPLSKTVDEAYAKKFDRNYSGTKTYTDFREVLQLKDIDAVVIDTPDHWHSIPVMMAAAAGKDMYCQKPLSLTIAEGRAMSDAVHKYEVVFQTGSQQRSNRYFRRVCELVRNGRIGKLHTIRCGLPGGTPDFGKTGHLTDPIAVPKGFDYEMWLGPAPSAPYSPARTHVNFRWVLDYSGGQVTDWGGHHPDIAHWGMNTEKTGPVKIQNAKAQWADHPVWNTATEFYFECLYANGLKLIISSREEIGGVKFEGSEGYAWATRGNFGASSAEIYYSQLGETDTHLYKSDNHYRNFIDCVYSREEPIAPVETAHRSITVGHLGNIAMKLGEDLEWDPDKEQFVNNQAANQMLARPMRDPWAAVYEKYKV